MKIADAIAILGLTGQKINEETVSAAYKAAAKKYHPDTNPAGLEMMKMVNAARDALADFKGDARDHQDTPQNYGEAINEALNAIFDIPGLDIEICGSWVWVGGNTKPHKETFKAAGYRWGAQKGRWYFRPDGWKSSARGNWSMDQIRDFHGSRRPFRPSRPYGGNSRDEEARDMIA